MKKSFSTATVCLAAAFLLLGCKKEGVTVDETAVTEQPVAEAPAPAPASAPSMDVMMSGEVVETMSTAGYTYVLVDDGSRQAWAAAPQFDVSVGDTVNVPPGQEMPEYHSNSLDRTFESVFFVPSISVGDAEAPAGEMPAGHPDTTPDSADISFDGIVKAEDGLTVADLFRDRENLAGKEVSIRGKCVKFSPAIMGTNWIHLQDGTDHEGANDLTVTSAAAATKGDTILVTGVVTVDKDFGAGYRYDLIIEDAQVTVE